MRIILISATIMLAFSVKVFAQTDFRTLDTKTFDYFIKGDFRNLKKTADTMVLQGMDYYYLRMRLGILAYNKKLFQIASLNFTKALEFNSLDTISREYLYYGYLLSGRKEDANLYLNSMPGGNRNKIVKSSGYPVSSEFHIGSSFAANDVVLYATNSLNYEAIKSSININVGVETHFSPRFKGTLSFTNYNKTGTIYTPSDPTGKALNFSQNQMYAKLSYYILPGWEFSGFGHAALYSEVVTRAPQGNRFSMNYTYLDFLGGVGISKSGWKIRTGANISFSNFGSSSQLRGEAYFTWLPKGNLNLYFTSGWMGQTDSNWGGTYQASQEIGFKVSKSIWLESGFIYGTSFLYGRNQGSTINNSYQIPAKTIYGNIIILPWKHISITLMPYYGKNELYSWDLSNYARTDKQAINTFGGALKLTYKIR